MKLYSNKISYASISNHDSFFIENCKSNFQIVEYLVHRYKFYLAGTKKIVFDSPPYVLLELVSTCNLRCPMCFQTDKTFTRKPYMGIIELDFFRSVIDQCRDLGVGALTLGSRGEPTMHPEFLNMLQYLKKNGRFIETKLNTNATYLNEKICHNIFENNLNVVVISADHYEKENYEKLRKNSDFEKVVNNLKILFKIRKKYYPKSRTEIRVSGIDYYNNLNRNKFYGFWSQYSDSVSSSPASKRWDTYFNEPSNISSPCSNLWDRMYIWFDGKSNPCDVDYKSYLSYGNVKELGIEKVWKSKKLKELRTTHLNSNRENIIPCDRCDAD